MTKPWPKVKFSAAADGRDNTAALRAALKYAEVVEFGPGDFYFDGSLLDGFDPDFARFCIRGCAPVTSWQHENEGGPDNRTFTRLIVRNLPAEKHWLNFVSPEGTRSGPQIIENLSIYREQCGHLLRFAGAGPVNATKCAARGLLLRDVYLSAGNDPAQQWPRTFAGKELPALTGTALELSDQYDARIDGVSVWGFENQLVAADCDRLKVRDWHGGNCARSIVIPTPRFSVPAVIDGVHIENVTVSGIDAECADIRSARVEVGYFAKVGPSSLPPTATWRVQNSGSRVEVSGVDPSKWIAARSVVRLLDKHLYVQTVDEKGFTFYGHDAHCIVPGMQGTGQTFTRLLGVPFILRGDLTSLDGYSPEMNKSLSGLPSYACFPRKTAIKLSRLLQGQGLWSLAGASNEGIVGGWSERQWHFGGCVVTQDAWLRPNHPWVYDAEPAFDANKRKGK